MLMGKPISGISPPFLVDMLFFTVEDVGLSGLKESNVGLKVKMA